VFDEHAIDGDGSGVRLKIIRELDEERSSYSTGKPHMQAAPVVTSFTSRTVTLSWLQLDDAAGQPPIIQYYVIVRCIPVFIFIRTYVDVFMG
jgi:hypothetical protein